MIGIACSICGRHQDGLGHEVRFYDRFLKEHGVEVVTASVEDSRKRDICDECFDKLKNAARVDE